MNEVNVTACDSETHSERVSSGETMAGRFGRLGFREKTIEKLTNEKSDEEGLNELLCSEESVPDVGTGTGGCLACRRDDDHANLILCDCCNDEYHIYCLDPPLRTVPTGDWFCGE